MCIANSGFKRGILPLNCHTKERPSTALCLSYFDGFSSFFAVLLPNPVFWLYRFVHIFFSRLHIHTIYIQGQLFHLPSAHAWFDKTLALPVRIISSHECTEIWARERVEWTGFKRSPSTARRCCNWPTVPMGASKCLTAICASKESHIDQLNCSVEGAVLSAYFFTPPLLNIDYEVDIWQANIDCWQSVGVAVVWRLHSTHVTSLQLSEGTVDKAKGIFYKALQHIPWVKVSSHPQFCPRRHLFRSTFYHIFFCSCHHCFLECCSKNLCFKSRVSSWMECSCFPSKCRSL